MIGFFTATVKFFWSVHTYERSLRASVNLGFVTEPRSQTELKMVELNVFYKIFLFVPIYCIFDSKLEHWESNTLNVGLKLYNLVLYFLGWNFRARLQYVLMEDRVWISMLITWLSGHYFGSTIDRLQVNEPSRKNRLQSLSVMSRIASKWEREQISPIALHGLSTLLSHRLVSFLSIANLDPT